MHPSHLIPCHYRGGSKNFLWGGRGGGGSKLWFRMDCFGTFLWQITSSHIPSHQSQLHIIGQIVAKIVDQLKKQRQPLVSQSVNVGRHWRGKNCFVRRGEQIIGGNSKTIIYYINYFLNIPGIQFSGKMQRAFR